MYVSNSRRPGYSPRLTKDQWSNLSPDDRRIWDQLSDKGKSSIMSRSNDTSPRTPSSSPSQRKVNISELTVNELVACIHDLELPVQHDAAQNSTETANEDAESNITVQTSNTKSSKHPGSLKHLLGNDRKETTKGNRSVKYSDRKVFGFPN